MGSTSIVVDEFQDCEGELLELAGPPAMASSIVVAADDFQYLSNSEVCPACQWLQEQNTELVTLGGNNRTTNNLLHETAAALREGRGATRSIEVYAPDAPGLAAWQISSLLNWGTIPAAKTKVLISPARPRASQWVQGILNSLEKELGKKKKLRPCPFWWERSEDDDFVEARTVTLDHVGSADHVEKPVLQLLARSDRVIVRMAAVQAQRLMSLRGQSQLPLSELLDTLRKVSHSAPAYRHDRPDLRSAMTIHGAKNREFDYVFIVWPYEVQDDNLLKRKLLYNAVTRAREGAILFVQGGEKRVENDAALSLLRCGLAKQKSQRSGIYQRSLSQRDSQEP